MALLHQRRRSAWWRIHFWAALLASPFALAAALTGLLYVFTPQIEHHLYAHLDEVTPQGPMRSLDEAFKAAQTAVPADWRLQAMSPAAQASDSHQFAFVPPAMHKPTEPEHGQHLAATSDKPSEFLKLIFGFPKNAVVVYVNPYSLEVLGQLAQQDRFTNWARKLHSNWLQSNAWRWMIELAASWLLVLLITGLGLAIQGFAALSSNTRPTRMETVACVVWRELGAVEFDDHAHRPDLESKRRAASAQTAGRYGASLTANSSPAFRHEPRSTAADLAASLGGDSTISAAHSHADRAAKVAARCLACHAHGAHSADQPL